jgi:hypothetical protein
VTAPSDTPAEARYRAEARAELYRIARRVYWEDRPILEALGRETPSGPAPGSGGPTPSRGLRPEGREDTKE